MPSKAQLEEDLRQARLKAQDTLSNLMRVPEAMQSAARTLNNPLMGQQMPQVTAPEPLTLHDLAAWLDSMKNRAVGYYRGYIQPRLQDLLR